MLISICWVPTCRKWNPHQGQIFKGLGEEEGGGKGVLTGEESGQKAKL